MVRPVDLRGETNAGTRCFVDVGIEMPSTTEFRSLCSSSGRPSSKMWLFDRLMTATSDGSHGAWMEQESGQCEAAISIVSCEAEIWLVAQLDNRLGMGLRVVKADCVACVAFCSIRHRHRREVPILIVSRL